MARRINRFLATLEWRWSLGNFVWAALTGTSFVLPAWATRAAGVFSQYAPLSWVAAGFAGLLSYAVGIAVYGYGRRLIVRARYDAKFLAESGGIDPLAKVFEGKRIFLNDFILPSNPIVMDKTFVDCEIVGPANIWLASENAINDVRPGLVDAVALSGEKYFNNGFSFRNCTFRSCTFHRVTIFFSPHEVNANAKLDWLNWISPFPQQRELLTEEPSKIEDLTRQLNEDTEEGTPD
jgi:hypothetical protein